MTVTDRRSSIRLVLIALGLFVAIGMHSIRADGLYWERIPIQHTLPSHIFTALGLTHTTRNGYTRGVPRGRDENFPPGLTDIIPYDTMSMLIVRGTVDAVAIFREKVQALDVPQPTWTLQFRLIDPKSQAVLGMMVKSDALMDDSEVANISDGTVDHAYRFHLYPAGRSQVAIVLRTGVAAPATSGLPVFAPSIVWLNPVSKTTDFQSPVVFNDLASDRATAHSGLGASPSDSGLDYSVEITVTPNALATAAAGSLGTPVAPAGANNTPGNPAPPIVIQIDPPAGANPGPAPNPPADVKP